MGKWKTVKLGNAVDVINGFAFQSKNYVKKGYRVIRITNVQKGVIVDNDPKFYSSCKALDKYELYENDLLISLTGNVGRVGLIQKDLLPAYLNQRVACLREKNQLISKKFLFSFLNSDEFEKACIVSSKGLAQKNMSTEWLKEYQIPLPPLDVQQKIADVLGKASTLIKLRKAQLEKLDLLIKSQFIEMFGDPVINPKRWPLESLGNLGELNRGVSKHRPRNAPELLDGPYPLLQTGEVTKADLYITDYNNTYSEIGLAQSRMWPKGTLCITIAANIAQTAILSFDACFPDSVVGFIPGEKTNQIYIHYWFGFLQKILEEQAPQVAQKNINLQILNDLDVTVPAIEFQNQFVSFVLQVNKSKIALQQSLEKLELNYKSLMQKCFRGEIF